MTARHVLTTHWMQNPRHSASLQCMEQRPFQNADLIRPLLPWLKPLLASHFLAIEAMSMPWLEGLVWSHASMSSPISHSYPLAPITVHRSHTGPFTILWFPAAPSQPQHMLFLLSGMLFPASNQVSAAFIPRSMAWLLDGTLSPSPPPSWTAGAMVATSHRSARHPTHVLSPRREWAPRGLGLGPLLLAAVYAQPPPGSVTPQGLTRVC